MQKAVLFIFILGVFSSCKRSVVEPPSNTAQCNASTQVPPGYQLSSLVQVDHNITHCGYMPLGKKNYWVYLDSLFDNNGQFTSTRIDTLRFTKTFMSQDSLIWWVPNKWEGYLTYNYSTDSVLYTLGNRWDYGLQVKWAFDIPVNYHFAEFQYTDGAYTRGEAWKLSSSVVVPAGSFSNCLRFRKMGLFAQDIDFDFKPGVGILKLRFYIRSATSAMYTKSSTLLSFNVE